MDITEELVENPIIAAIRNEAELNIALENNPKVVFVLSCSILDVEDICLRLKEKGKIVFVHLDMVEGLKGDAYGIKYIKSCQVDGIISTRVYTIKQANKQGLMTIQRIFMIDSQSLKTGVQGIIEAKPTAIEIMPGVAGKIIEQMSKATRVPIIAGGLIKEKAEVMEVLAAGAIAISTTAQGLWNL